MLGDQEDDDDDVPAPATFRGLHKDSPFARQAGAGPPTRDDEDAQLRESGLRRTNSGMFMPFEEGEDDGRASNGLFGRITETYNTARDICYVLYNVGWRR